VAIIVQADIEAVFGATNVAIWSNLDSDSTTAVTARISAAIEYAEAWVNDEFRDSRYVVPLTPNTGTHSPRVKNWCAVMAGEWLYRPRQDDSATFVGRHVARVNAEIGDARGRGNIDYTLKERAGSAPWVG